jgi:hypothetical protein
MCRDLGTNAGIGAARDPGRLVAERRGTLT